MSKMSKEEIEALMPYLNFLRAADMMYQAFMPDTTSRDRIIYLYDEGMKSQAALMALPNDTSPEQALDEIVELASSLLMRNTVSAEHEADLAWIVNNLSKHKLS